ncbi:MAG: hypothetical protein EBX50_16230 [Chitinophagia bacterium]|nr:hypothetical protein [Chitinophagia bacterium]
MIDTNITTSTLNVSTGITTGTLLATSTISAANVNATTISVGNLNITGQSQLNSKILNTRAVGDNNHGLAHASTNTPVNLDGPILWGNVGGALGYQNGSGTSGILSSLTWNSSGISSSNAQVSGTISAGTLRAGTLAATTVTTANVNIGYMTIGNFLVTSGGAGFGSGTMLEFGYGVVGKELNAGRIGYATFTANTLDILGGGTSYRTVKIWDGLTVGDITTNTLIAGTVTAGTVTASNMGAPTISAGTLAAATITSANVTSLNTTTGNLLIKSGAGLLMNNGEDAYNQLQLFNNGHDNLAINFDMYYPTTTGTSKTASHTSYFQIQKLSSQLNFNYGTSAAGSSGNLVGLYRALSISSSDGLVVLDNYLFIYMGQVMQIIHYNIMHHKMDLN